MTSSCFGCHLASSCFGYLFLKGDHFFLFVLVCEQVQWSGENVMPQQCLMQNPYWICRHECNPRRCEWKFLFLSCKCPSCGCKCEFVCMWCKCFPLKCLMQRSLSNMQTWTQPYDGATENFMRCKCFLRKCICEFYARDANVWNINQLYHFQNKAFQSLWLAFAVIHITNLHFILDMV